MEPIGAPRWEAESSHVPFGRKASLWYQLFFFCHLASNHKSKPKMLNELSSSPGPSRVGGG